MMWLSDTPSTSCSRIVRVAGEPVFDLRFNERCGETGPPDPRHGVANADVVDQYAAALEQSFERLCSTEFGWVSALGTALPRCPRALVIRDLGPSLFGAAVAVGDDVPYLVLNCRPFEPSRREAERRRRAVVAHELTHLLQFETATYRYWPDQGSCGESDPNWCLHETTALAAEAAVYPDEPDCYASLWDWATTPECSFESDPSGSRAAPFLMYLMRAIDPTVSAAIYRVMHDSSPLMRGTELMAAALRVHQQVLAACEGPDCFSRYCVDAAFVGDPGTVLDPAIAAVVGARARTDVFRSYPIHKAATRAEIDHLGCRYFEFCPTSVSGRMRMRITLRPSDSNGKKLRGELVSVAVDGTRSTSVSLRPDENGDLIGTVEEFVAAQISRVVLTVVNCAYGGGWLNYDQAQFSISATVE